jgi:phage terminase large subunit-like protein
MSERSGLDAFVRFCAALTVESGEPMTVEGFQRLMLADYFGGATETLILIPKKNGKTTLLGALGLFHLIVTPDAECVIAAASRDQATILFDQAAGFVRRTSGLADRVVIRRGYREIRSRRDAGRMRVLAADVDTVDGVIPTLALIDELHRHRRAGLYGIFRDGLGPRKGRLIAISTAGDSEATPLGEMRAQARLLPIVERDGRHLRARSADGAYAMHEWALDNADDVEDMTLVKLVNPASWWTPETLAQAKASPTMLPSQWARYRCGLWMAGDAWWVDAEQWRGAARPAERLVPGERVALGFDGSRTGDSTALVACRLSDGLVSLLRIWEADEANPEWEVPRGEVDAAIADAFERFSVVRGYFDPPLWQSEIDEWAHTYGETAVVRFATNRTAMMAATERFRTDLVAGRLTHDGDATLTRHALNTQIREVRGGYWLAKDRASSANKIDAAVAAVLAYEARADALASDVPRRSRRLITL